MTEEREDLTDPDPEQQDPESGAAAEDVDVSEFEDDPARNPDDENIEKYKGG
jgi:hypothetical protein